MENVNLHEEDMIDDSINRDDLRNQLLSLKNEILIYKTKNSELNKSLERSNTLLREERKRRLSDRSPAHTPVKDLVCIEAELQQQQQEPPLQTITELPSVGERMDVVPARRLSLERRRSAEIRLTNGGDESPRSRGSFIEDDTQERRKLYGQRKSSISLDDMYDLFDVNSRAAIPVPLTKRSDSPSSTVETPSFEVSLNGNEINSEKEF